MNWTKALVGEGEAVAAPDRTEQSVAILAVGDTRTWTAGGGRLPSDGLVFFAEFHEVTADLLARLLPRLILSPLLARNFDCVDLAQLLWALGFHGRYRAIDSGLPDPALIVREVRLLVPDLDFDIVPLR